MRQNIRTLAASGTCALALALTAGVTTKAEAAFMAYICGSVDCSVVATTLIVTDNGAGDTNATVGVITSSFSIGGLTVLVNTSQSKPVLGSASAPQLDLTFTISGVGHVWMYTSDTGFTGVGTLTSLFNGNQGAGAGSVREGVFDGINNLNPVAGGLPGNVLAVSPSFLTGAGFSESLTTGVVGVAANPYALTIGVDVIRTAAGTTTGDLNVRQNRVPEPASLALLGIGLAAAGFATRRRQS